jgi:hypothetical protein
MDRVTQSLWRGVEGPRLCLIYPCRSELFNHGARHGFFLEPGTKKRPGIKEDYSVRKDVPVTIKCVSRQTLLSGFRRLKSSEQHG